MEAKPIPSTSGSVARWTDSEVEQEMELLSFEPRQQTNRLLKGGCQHWKGSLPQAGMVGNLRTHLTMAG